VSELVPQAGLRGKGPSDRWAQFGSEQFPDRRPIIHNTPRLPAPLADVGEHRSTLMPDT
jgi:hypothetical protein